MACAPLDKNNARNSIKNSGEFFVFKQPSAVNKELISNRLDQIKATFALTPDQAGYGFRGDTEKAINMRVTEWVAKTLNRRPRQSISPNNQIKMDAGTFVHKAMEELIIELYTNEGKNLAKLEKLFTSGAGLGFKASKSVFNELVDLAKKTIQDITETQNTIDPTKKADIKVEQVIVDPVKDRAGTIDILAVYSDATVGLFDYKTSEREGDLTTNLVSWHSFEGYQTQLNDYGRMLQERYQAKGIRQSRLIPIQLNLAMTKKKGAGVTYHKEIEKVIHSTDYTKVMPTSAERTGTKEIDSMLDSQFSLIKSYQERIRATKDQSKRTALITKLDSIYGIVQNLLVTQQAYDVVHAVNTIMRDLDERKYYPESSEDYLTDNELLMMQSELKSYMNLPNYFNSLYQTMKEQGNQPKEVMKSLERILDGNLAGLITRAKGDIEEIMTQRVVENMPERYVETDDTGRQFIAPAPNISISQLNWGKLSEIQHPAFVYLRDRMKNAYMKIDDSVKEDGEYMLKVEEAFLKWASDNGLSQNEAYAKIINMESNNRHMYSRYSSEFFEARDKAQEGKDTSFFKKYYNKSEDADAIYEKSRKEQISRLKMKYNRFKPIMEGDKVVKSEDDLRKAFSRELKSWEKFNNLKNDEAWRNRMLINNGTLQLDLTKAAAFETKEYKYIQSIPALADMYNMVEGYNKKYRDMLGMTYGELPNNFLPFVRMDFIEGIFKYDKGLGKFSSESIQSMFQTREDDTFMGARDPNTGELKRTIPIFYTNPLRNAEGEIDPSLKSTDIVRSMILFSEMAHNFSYKSEIEDEILMMQSLMASDGPAGVSHAMRTKGGKVAIDHMARKAMTRLGMKADEYNLFSQFVNYYVYGIKFEDANKYTDVEVFGRQVNPIKAAYELKKTHTKIKLAFPILTAGSAAMAVKTALDVEAKRGVLFDKEDLNQAYKELGTEFNKSKAFAHFFNIYGRQVSAEYTQKTLKQKKSSGYARRFGTTDALLRPLTFMDEGADIVGALALANNYTVKDGKLARKRKGDKSLKEMMKYNDKTDKWSIDGLSDTEVFNVRTAFKQAAQELNYRTKGTPNSYDVSGSDLNIGMSLLMHYKSWMPGLLRARYGKMRFDDNTLTLEMGRYRAAFQEMKLPKEDASILNYIYNVGAELLQLLMEAGTFGLVRTYSKPNKKTAQMIYNAFIAENPHLADEVTFDDFVQLKENQLRALTKEVRVITMFIVAGALLFGGDDEEGKEGEKQFADYMRMPTERLLRKAIQEMRFAIDPKEYLNLISNPLPVAGLFADVINVFTNGTQETMDLISGQRDPHDRTPFGYFFLNLIPVLPQFRNIIPLFDEDERIRTF